MGIHYYSNSSKKLFAETVNQEILTFSKPIKPEEVALVFLSAHPDKVHGSWGIDALTIKKSLFEKSGVFNTQLKLQQDVDLFIKMSLVGNFYPGELVQPTCIRGVHDQQRSTNSDLQAKYRTERWKSLNKWMRCNIHVKPNYKKLFKNKYYTFLIINSNRIKAFYFLIISVLRNPNSILKSYGDFDFNFWKVFGKNWVTLRLIAMKNKMMI
jgi:hypothetical protein